MVGLPFMGSAPYRFAFVLQLVGQPFALLEPLFFGEDLATDHAGECGAGVVETGARLDAVIVLTEVNLVVPAEAGTGAQGDPLSRWGPVLKWGPSVVPLFFLGL